MRKLKLKLLRWLIYQEVQQSSTHTEKTIALYMMIRSCMMQTFYNDNAEELDKYAMKCFRESQSSRYET